MRRAVVAGRFYPRTKKEIKQKIESYITQIPEKTKEKEAQATVSPHAGYRFSGDVATRSISALRDAETYIIIGPSHQGTGTGISISQQKWETPLGEIEVDQDVNEELKTVGIVEEKAHMGEHSIEVQIPILQYLKKDFKIVPIMLSIQDLEIVKELSQRIIKITERGKDVAIISSSDFSHYQPKNIARKQDEEAIEKIKQKNTKKFFELIKEKNLSICGYGPIGVSMELANKNKLNSKLLEYKTSAEATGDTSQVVGYASIVFE
ncbi:hypothetical protein C9439_07580 [archaeon SCG-AAA382B04]|nr:hypothetical protein C9439_07580 [archaeon SCG-AAA382B04]